MDSTSPGRRISIPCLSTLSAQLFYTGCCMGMAQSPQPPGHFALSRSCTLSRLDSAWVTAQPQCQVRAHQAPWQMAGSTRALQFFTDCSAVSRLGFVSAFELSSGFVASVNWALQALESRWVCIAHLAAHAPQQRHPGPLEGLFLSGRRPEFWSISGH